MPKVEPKVFCAHKVVDTESFDASKMSERANKKRKIKSGSPPQSADTSHITDARFSNIQFDPRYRLPSKKHRVKLDSRFSQALKDDDFTRRAKVDRYGRPLRADAEREKLKRKYDFDEDESGSGESDGTDDDDEVQQELEIINSSRDILREGKYSDFSSSSSSSDGDSDSELDDTEDAELAPQTRSEVPTGEVSSRIAVVNLDWDNIRAQDLMAVFSSFLDGAGKLQHIAIYPSEFGKERLQREETEGPPKEIFTKSKSENQEDTDISSDSEDDEAIKSSMLKPDDGADFDSQALRKYQLERLRYFYAILTFSSPKAAKQIYDAVDGTEYLSTANFFDLRFVPDDTDFSADTPREECSFVPAEYKPNAFVTDALQHSNVKLTWDAEDNTRKEVVARAFRGGRKEIDENDLKAYLGSDSSDAEPDLEEATQLDATTTVTTSKKDSSRAKMRALLGLAPEPTTSSSAKSKDKAPIGNVQITFSAGLTGNDADENGAIKKRSVFANTEQDAMETTVEKYVRKERERKQRRKEKAKASREGGAIGATEDSDDEDDPEVTNPQAAGDANDDDLGFDDPFFAQPETEVSSTKQSSTRIRKEDRLKKKKEREIEEQNEARERRKLEVLMADDLDDSGVNAGPDPGDAKSAQGNTAKGGRKGVRHFDMKDILAAEKAERKAERKARKKKDRTQRRDMKKNEHGRETDDTAQTGDRFAVDASDPRFASRLFGNHEFAIDPLNPRYSGTKGMERLMEEGRKRKGQLREKEREVGGQGDDRTARRKGREDGDVGDIGGGDDVKGLVEKLKRKKK